MGIAFLLLGLMPLMFLPTMIDAPAEDESDPSADGATSGVGDLLDDPIEEGGDNPDILTPVDEDDQANDDQQPVDPDTVLAPVNEDDTLSPSDGNEGDVLLPVDEIESEYETIYLDASADAGLAYVEIENFEGGTDVLHVSLPPEMVQGSLDVDVTPSDDGLDAMVYVEQQLIAVLRGASDASREDVEVVIERLNI